MRGCRGRTTRPIRQLELAGRNGESRALWGSPRTQSCQSFVESCPANRSSQLLITCNLVFGKSLRLLTTKDALAILRQRIVRSRRVDEIRLEDPPWWRKSEVGFELYGAAEPFIAASEYKLVTGSTPLWGAPEIGNRVDPLPFLQSTDADTDRLIRQARSRQGLRPGGRLETPAAETASSLRYPAREQNGSVLRRSRSS